MYVCVRRWSWKGALDPLVHSWGCCAPWQDIRAAGVWGSWSCDIHCQEADRDECWLLAYLFLFCLSQTPPHGMVPPTLRVGVHSLVKYIWKYLYRHTQRCISTVILRLVKLIIKINCHNADQLGYAFKVLTTMPSTQADTHPIRKLVHK